MRHIFSRNNGNLGSSGSVAWMFHKKGQIVVPNPPKTGDQKPLSEDDLLAVILDAGADDMTSDENAFTITTTPQAFDAVKKAIEDKGIAMESAAVQMVPENMVKVSGKEAEHVLKLMEALEEHDDVQNVYANFDIDEKEMAALQP
jgi:transcriptional/translational regulatory protein YebC/TACO1